MNKREQLIDIATRLFSERGFENTPLSAVCEAAQVSKGLISHHFKSKNGLLREIFKKTTQLIIDINRTKKPEQSPSEGLLDLLNSFFTQLKADKMLFQFNLNVMVQPQTRELLKDLIQERSSFILASTEEIFKKIDPDNARIKSYMFVAELDGIALHYLGIFEDYPLQDMKAQLIKRYIQS